MEYINVKTGVTIFVASEIHSDNYKRVDEQPKSTQKPKKKEK